MIEGCIIVTFIVQWLLGASLISIWNLLNILQFVSQLPMMMINFPQNSQMVHEKITTIATFQILPTDFLDYEIYGLSADDRVPLNTNFELAGHDSCLFILSIGTPWYYLLLLILVLLIKCLFKRCPRISQKLDMLAR